MIVHTNIEQYTIFYSIMHGPQICTINKRLVIAGCNDCDLHVSSLIADQIVLE